MPRRGALLLLAALLLTGCGAAPAGSRFPLPGDADARRWGDGPYGLVLVPDAGREPESWDPQARAFAQEGMTVVAVPADEAAVTAAIEALQDGGVERVALLAAGAGSPVALSVGAQRPELVDQLIVISATGEAAALGVFPKLFVASEDEPAASAAARMTDEAPGDWNALYLAPGSASGQAIFEGDGAEAAMEAIRQRLGERR